MMNRQAIVLVTSNISASIIDKYRRIQIATKHFADTYLLIDSQIVNISPTILDKMKDIIYICFDWENIKEIGFKPLYKDSIIPGSNHFILLWFRMHYPNYDYYWNLEYDVEYSGEWNDFFDKTQKLKSDFLSSCIRFGIECQDWYWLGSYYSTDMPIHPLKRIRSFNPVYRISSEAIDFLIHFHKKGAVGHHEVLIPTSLYYQGFSIIDMGGRGKFVIKGYEDLIYTEFPNQQEKGSMRFRPVFMSGEIEKFRNKLCHPVK